ncbi:MAG: hypothetical protein PHI35_08095 [Victivallaceae bacterium]|nr:hypothetical protein [Victivallaceae bacterium]
MKKLVALYGLIVGLVFTGWLAAAFDVPVRAAGGGESQYVFGNRVDCNAMLCPDPAPGVRLSGGVGSRRPLSRVFSALENPSISCAPRLTPFTFVATSIKVRQTEIQCIYKRVFPARAGPSAYSTTPDFI